MDRDAQELEVCHISFVVVLVVFVLDFFWVWYERGGHLLRRKVSWVLSLPL